MRDRSPCSPLSGPPPSSKPKVQRWIGLEKGGITKIWRFGHDSDNIDRRQRQSHMSVQGPPVRGLRSTAVRGVGSNSTAAPDDTWNECQTRKKQSASLQGQVGHKTFRREKRMSMRCVFLVVMFMDSHLLLPSTTDATSAFVNEPNDVAVLRSRSRTTPPIQPGQ